MKADGLAAGKGVYICEDIKQSISAVEEIFNGKFGEAKEILIEEFLNGEEMSFLSFQMEKILKLLELLKITKEFLRAIKEK